MNQIHPALLGLSQSIYGQIIFSMFWNFTKNSKKQIFEKLCFFENFTNMNQIHPALLGLSHSIYGKIGAYAKSHEKYLNVEKKL